MKKTVLTTIFFVLSSLAPAAELPQVSITQPVIGAAGRQDSVQDEITRISQIKATVTKVNGGVNVRSRGSLFWHDPRPGDMLRPGDEISTKADGKIEFRLENGNMVKLKPSSHLMISKMTENKLTGDYENFFEADIGKIMAKIEKIKGASTFKIKTPTAIAGARGTIIYLNIMPDMTAVLFTGGPGFFTNTISGETFNNIQPDTGSRSDSGGNVTEPGAPSGDQLQEFLGGWDFVLGAEGYSAPDDAGEMQDELDESNDEQDEAEAEAELEKIINQLIEKTSYEDILKLLDFDGDGIPDITDWDDDNDGLSDIIEDLFGVNSKNVDTDADGLTDAFEALLFMNPTQKDTDGDGILDPEEIKQGLSELFWDSDGDGADDVRELLEGTDPLLESSFPHGLTYDRDLDGEPDTRDWDADGDGLANITETRLGLNPLMVDSDGDGVSDRDEITEGIPENRDTDGDKLYDVIELMAGTDPNRRDTDGDGRSDYDELGWWGYGEDEETDKRIRSNPLVKDSDRDGVSDYDEVTAGTDPDHPLYYPAGFNNDPDKDGIPGEWDWDSDGDGISDFMEAGMGDDDMNFGTDPFKADTDGDGVNDGIEIAEGTNPLSSASFNSVRLAGSDRYIKDTDGDGIPDQLEIEIGLLDLDKERVLDPNNTDTDGDGLSDGIEAAAGLDPFDKDTDNDGLEDGYEALRELNPFGITLDPFRADMDNDGLTDREELLTTGTRSDRSDTDNDGLKDGAELRDGSNPKLKDTDGDAYGKFDGSDGEDAFPNNSAFPKIKSRGGIGNDGESYLTDDPAAYGSRNQIRAKRQELIEQNELRREIKDMLSDMSARYNDSVMERVSDAQTGKVLIDAQRYRVRVEQYVLRPNDTTVELLNITLRTNEAKKGLAGIHTLDWKTTFNKPLGELTSHELRDLPWADYLEGAVGGDGRVTGGPNYGSAEPVYYPTEMSVRMSNPDGDVFNETRTLGSLYSGNGWRQDITGDQIYVDGAWRNFAVSAEPAGENGVGGFTYNPEGMSSDWNIRAKFYVIGDGETGEVSNIGAVRFDTIWDALAVNMAGHQQIGENNLEISIDSQLGGNGNRKIDIIYVPWNRQNWRQNHSWRNRR